MLERNDSQKIIPLYNNLARINGLFKNQSEEILYYEKAKDLITKDTNKYLCHIIYQNLISRNLLLNNLDNASQVLLEYSKIIDDNNKYDLLKYNNFMLIYNRQINDREKLIETVGKYNMQLYPRLNKKEKLSSDISELNIRYNNMLGYKELLQKIWTNINEYNQFDLADKLHAYKVIYIVLTNSNSGYLLHPFEELYNYIFNFFQNASLYIDNYIKNEVDDFQIYQKCKLIEEKIHLSNFQRYEHKDIFSIICKKIKLLEEIGDIYQYSGNIILAFETKLNYLDECMGSTKNPIPDIQIRTLKEMMIDRFEDVEKGIKLFEKHPEVSPYLIRIARYALFIDNIAKAQYYIQKFDSMNISINHFSGYIQQYYYEIKEALKQK